MTDEPVRTEVRTDDGWLDFQDYFVRLRQAPDVREVRFARDRGRPADAPRSRPRSTPASSIVIAPSNPIVSVGPILARARACASALGDRAGARRAGRRRSAGSSAARRSRARRTGCSRRSATRRRALGVARAATPGSSTTFVLDTVDAALAPAVEALGIRAVVTDTIMTDDAARARCAGEVLRIAAAA